MFLALLALLTICTLLHSLLSKPTLTPAEPSSSSAKMDSLPNTLTSLPSKAKPSSNLVTVRTPRLQSLAFRAHQLAFGSRAVGGLSLQLRPSPQLDFEDEALLVERSVVRERKELREVSSWGIGGPCAYFLQVTRVQQLVGAIRYCRDRCVPFLIVGKGSNCLFDDQGFNGFVMLNKMDQFEVIEPGVYRVGSGYPFNRLGVRCSIEGFSGLEFAGGIPGTVGGAVYMNAGANGQETSDVIESVEVVTKDGELKVFTRSDISFGYRWSSFQAMDNLAAVVAVTFRLAPGDAARDVQRAFLQKRRKTQPIGERSAGSVFRNPLGVGISAGELIELAGLKGFTIGGARVSNLHANFFINFNGSTSKDMLQLINHVKETVDQLFQIELKEEIKYIPYKMHSL